ncbi:hypothetical protein G9A89_019317 [Geosiphon pyriformis]|nr:hypothetical protein G9A89_019317 [Geosiphon pyriformis]
MSEFFAASFHTNPHAERTKQTFRAIANNPNVSEEARAQATEKLSEIDEGLKANNMDPQVEVIVDNKKAVQHEAGGTKKPLK